MDCDCTESCAMADRFTPATRELMVFTKSAKRYFDLDAVRELGVPGPNDATVSMGNVKKPADQPADRPRGQPQRETRIRYGSPAGAPPLDWWKIDPDIPYTPQPIGEQMPATFYVGDAIEVMGKLPENSVDLILTSPPFLALRSYLPADHPDKGKEGGSQSTPGEFIDWLLDVAEACDRVLAPHGSLCIELGDTYAGGGSGLATYSDDRGNPDGMRDTTFSGGNTKTGGGSGWPLAKSLSLIPESFRFAMVYGRNPHTGRTTEPWRLRNVIRWVRPNPPVGALGDKFRPATSELMVFCKSAKRYFDLDAVREPYAPSTVASHTFGADSAKARSIGDKAASGQTGGEMSSGKNFLTHAGAPPLDWWNIPLLEGEEETRYGKQPRPTGGGPAGKKAAGVGTGRTQADADRWHEGLSVRTEHPLGSPPLDWWEIPPGGYEGAHYAVFPPELCVKPVKAMCPEKVCRQCGEPSRRIVGEAEYVRSDFYTGQGRQKPSHAGDLTVNEDGDNAKNASWQIHASVIRTAPTVGFSDCGHDDWRPGMVLDPFVGSGTTLMVATGHGRDAIGIDLDERNFDLALERVGPFILTRGDDD